MSIDNDPLDGFRAPLSTLAAQIEKMAPNDALWQRLYLGDTASKLMRGVAQRADIAKVMAMMIAQCELDAQACCRELIHETSLSTEAARKAHFDARVSAGILGRLNQYVNDGIAAGAELNQSGDTR